MLLEVAGGWEILFLEPQQLGRFHKLPKGWADTRRSNLQVVGVMGVEDLPLPHQSREVLTGSGSRNKITTVAPSRIQSKLHYRCNMANRR